MRRYEMVDDVGKQDRGAPATGKTREYVMLARCAPRIGDICIVMSQGGSEYRKEHLFHEGCHGKKAEIVGTHERSIDIKMLEGGYAGDVFPNVLPEILLLEVHQEVASALRASPLRRFESDMLP